MSLPKLINNRFIPEDGLRIIVQVPDTHVQKLINAIMAKDKLNYGGYDSVMFKTATGVQQFESLGTGHNPASGKVIEISCVEISFFLPNDETKAVQILETIYATHPYEEPVVFVLPCVRTLHITGVDEDNPNKIWNKEKADWYPENNQN
ncbi:MAG: hypothetical protein AAF490_24865 [Chloroflexota bacterium]